MKFDNVEFLRNDIDWNFSREAYSSMIDIHTHILPMLDDGPETVKESIEMCRVAASDGIKKIVATPHVGNGVYNVDITKIPEKINMLNELVSKDGLDLEILPGAEVYLNDQILNAKVLKESNILTLNGNKKYLLLEFSVQWIPIEADQIIFALKTTGITPVLPHLERNSRVQANPGIVKRFVELGAVLQVTAQSILGNFGGAPKKCALWMLKNNLVHVIASDAHSLTGRPPILSSAVKVVRDMLGDDSARKMVFDNPDMIVKGMPTIE